MNIQRGVGGKSWIELELDAALSRYQSIVHGIGAGYGYLAQVPDDERIMAVAVYSRMIAVIRDAQQELLAELALLESKNDDLTPPGEGDDKEGA